MMPTAARKICAAGGCGVICEAGETFCCDHKQFMNVSRHKYAHWYQSTRWKRLRGKQLKHQPICEECRKHDRLTPATDVDHIVPHMGRVRLMWNMQNLQSLCKSCHSRKTAREVNARAQT